MRIIKVELEDGNPLGIGAIVMDCSGVCGHSIKNCSIGCYHRTTLLITRARFDKNGRKSIDPRSDYYCAKSIIEESDRGNIVPFASSEVDWIRRFYSELLEQQLVESRQNQSSGGKILYKY